MPFGSDFSYRDLGFGPGRSRRVTDEPVVENDKVFDRSGGTIRRQFARSNEAAEALRHLDVDQMAISVTQRTQRVTSLLISRSQSTELAIATQNTQSCGLKLTVPNAR